MIAPPPPPKSGANNHADEDADSDSDWDDDDDFASKKINIKIKPIAQVTPSKISASVDELRATVGTWKSLANINLVKPNSRRHHQSTAQLNNLAGQESGRRATMLAPSAHSAAAMPQPMVLTSEPPVRSLSTIEYKSRQEYPRSSIDSYQTNDNSNNPMLDLANIAPAQQESAPDLVRFNNLNSIKPSILDPQNNHELFNGFLNPSPTQQAPLMPAPLSSSMTAPLTPNILTPELFNGHSKSSKNELSKFPVAFAIQECLNARVIKGDGNYASLIGRVKLAVPPKIVTTDFSGSDHRLEVMLVSSKPWDKINLNSLFVSEVSEQIDSAQQFIPSTSTKRLLIDMEAIKTYVRTNFQVQRNTKYFILPDLINYVIGSQAKIGGSNENGTQVSTVNPLNIQSHWLCDLNVTKVRLDIQSIEETLADFGLSTDQFRNLKISVDPTGSVVSYQSKPESNWNALSSKLTWSFNNLAELVSESTLNNITSCLARFSLNDGPSTPSDVNLQFSIAGKSISGSQVIVQNTKSFRLAMHKSEVRTGVFKCETPRL